MARKKQTKTKVTSILVLFLTMIAIIIGINEYPNMEDSITNENSQYTDVTEVKAEETEKTVSGNLKIYFFDVGQADSILILQEDKAMLIDAGNNKDGKLIVDYLHTLNINKIDYLVGTHPHEDHIGGLDDIINNFEIGQIFMPKKSSNTKTFEDVLNAISDKGLKVKAPEVGYTFNLGEAKCTIMSIENDAENANESSIVIQIDYGNEKYLFTGDAESTNELARSWEDIDVLKIGHHGSSTSSSKKFLEETKPEIAIISVGEGNSYNHPHEETLDKLEAIGSTVYRTDIDGTILLESDGNINKIQKLQISLDGDK